MRLASRSLAALIALLSLLSHPAWAADCSQVSKDLPGQKKDATASLFANVRGSEGSIKYEARRLLGSAFSTGFERPAAFCPEGCTLPAKPLIIYRSIPKKYRSDYSDKALCEKRKKETEASPIVFKGKVFRDVEALVSWFGDLSQMKGPDGAALLKQCPGDCSPQYTSTISEKDSGSSLLLDASIVCGPARDKDDNQFELSTTYRWVCQTAR